MRRRYLRQYYDGSRVIFFNEPKEPDTGSKPMRDVVFLYPNTSQEKTLWPYAFGYERSNPVEAPKNAMITDRFIIYFAVGGHAYFNDTSIGAGDVFMYYPGTPHRFYNNAKKPIEFYWVELSGSELMSYLDSIGLSPDKMIYPRSLRDTILKCFRSAIYEPSEGADIEMYYMALFNIIMSYCKSMNVSAQKPAPSLQEQYVLDAMHILFEKQYMMSVEAVAKHIGISRKYLSRLFKSQKGETLQQYIINHKMETAGKMIRSGLYSYKQIAENLGYYDYAAFSRNFNLYFGITPSEYDRIQKENKRHFDIKKIRETDKGEGETMKTNNNYAAELPVFDTYDVLVVGGGPSGICAAVSAARCGARVAVIERYGTLGGNMTLGNVGPFMGRVGPGTISREINRIANTKMPLGRIAQDIEGLEIELVEWVSAAGVKILLQCAVGDVLMEGNVICGVIASTPTGFQIFKAKIIIDATGNGLVALKAGVPMKVGREEDGLTQPVSLMFTLSNVDDTKLLANGDETYDTTTRNKEFIAKTFAASYSGMLPASAPLVRLYRSCRGNECIVNATHVNYIDGTNLNDIEKAELELREQIPWIIHYLRSNVPGFENCRLARSSMTLGVRESYRIVGEYTLTEEDLREGKRFPDVVVHGADFYFDVHGIRNGGQQCYEQAKPYDIPYRCLLPQKVENLLVVGRCISGTHLAHSSYRVMNIVMAIGQAGGVAAAAATAAGVTPRELPYQTVQEWLTKMGVDLWCDDTVLEYGKVKTAPKAYDPK